MDTVEKVFVAVVLSLLLAFSVMWLWNDVMPVVFHLPTLTFWQTFEILILADILFKPSSSSKD